MAGEEAGVNSAEQRTGCKPPRGIKYRLARGTRWKGYEFDSGEVLTVAYHTPSQSLALLEEDSARVFCLIAARDNNGEAALQYILDHGTFGSEPEREALDVLTDFLTELEGAGFLASHNRDPHCDEQSDAFRTIPHGLQRAGGLRRTEESRIQQIMADRHVLYSLVLELTYRCNERCIHCYCPSQRDCRELETDQVLDLVDEFEGQGGFLIQLTGGDVFLRQDIVPILKELGSRQLVVSVATNLTLATEQHLQLLAALAPRSIGCSIYSASAEVHDAITMQRGSHVRSVAAIRRLRELGVPVVIKTPLMSHTIRGWRKVEELALELGCEYQFDLNITAQNDGGLDPIALRATDTDAIRELMASRFYQLYFNDEPLQYQGSPSSEVLLCGAGTAGLAVSPDGTLRPCIGLTTSLGTWPEDSLTTVWNTSPFFADWAAMTLASIPKCRHCGFVAFCNRCPGAWQLENGDCRCPNGYTCFLAEIWASVDGGGCLSFRGVQPLDIP